MLTIRPKPRSRMPSITPRVMLNTESRLVRITSLHCSGFIRCKVASRVIPALLTSTSIGPGSASPRPARGGMAGERGVADRRLDRREISLDPGEAILARLEVGDVPLVHGNPGLLLEPVGRLVVAGVVRRPPIAGVLERHRDRLADAPRPPGHQCHARHVRPPPARRCLVLRRCNAERRPPATANRAPPRPARAIRPGAGVATFDKIPAKCRRSARQNQTNPRSGPKTTTWESPSASAAPVRRSSGAFGRRGAKLG